MGVYYTTVLDLEENTTLLCPVWLLRSVVSREEDFSHVEFIGLLFFCKVVRGRSTVRESRTVSGPTMLVRPEGPQAEFKPTWSETLLTPLLLANSSPFAILKRKNPTTNERVIWTTTSL